MLDPQQEPRENELPAEQGCPSADGESANELPSYLSGYPPVVALRDEPFPTWSAWDVATVLAFAGAAWVVISAFALGVARVAMGKQQVPVSELAESPLVALGAQSVTELAILIFMVGWIGRRSLQGFWKAIHWNWRGGKLPGLLLGGVALALFVDFVSRYLPIPKSLPVERFFNEAATAYLMSALGVILAPLLEELFFRGLFYPLVRRTVGVTLAVLLTATIFAFIHGAQLGYAWAPLLSIFVVGVVLTLVRQITESVAASYLVHCGYNLALFGMLWIGSDHFRHLEKVTN
jgi:membrane protease YdiL (CAAX protease family)